MYLLQMSNCVVVPVNLLCCEAGFQWKCEETVHATFFPDLPSIDKVRDIWRDCICLSDIKNENKVKDIYWRYNTSHISNSKHINSFMCQSVEWCHWSNVMSTLPGFGVDSASLHGSLCRDHHHHHLTLLSSLLLSPHLDRVWVRLWI